MHFRTSSRQHLQPSLKWPRGWQVYDIPELHENVSGESVAVKLSGARMLRLSSLQAQA